MISLLFAVKHEAAWVRAALSNADSFRIGQLTCVVGAYARQQISLGFVGMGEESASTQSAVFLKYFRPRFLIIAGYAGALVPGLSKGEVVVANNYLGDPSLALPPGLKYGPLASVSTVVGDRVAREALNRQTGAHLVDMETAAVAAEAARQEVPLLAIRAISDGLNDELPLAALAAAYDIDRQRTAPGRLVFHLLTHPLEIGPFAGFVSGLSPVRKSLTRVLLEIIRMNPGSE
jgi:adenosylhomocysteine nucleosidase